MTRQYSPPSPVLGRGAGGEGVPIPSDPHAWYSKLARLEAWTTARGGMDALDRDRRNMLWDYRKGWTAYVKQEHPEGISYDRLKKEWALDWLAQRDWGVDTSTDPTTDSLRETYERAQHMLLATFTEESGIPFMENDVVSFAAQTGIESRIILDTLRRLSRGPESPLVHDYCPSEMLLGIRAGPHGWYDLRSNINERAANPIEELEELNELSQIPKTAGSHRRQRLPAASPNSAIGDPRSAIDRTLLPLGDSYNGKW